MTFREVLFGDLNFDASIQDVKRLLSMHDAMTERRGGRPSDELEVLKRAAVILLVTAWESYVEDLIGYIARRRISSAMSPADVEGAFNALGEAWLSAGPKPRDLAAWTGDNWKDLLQTKLKQELDQLHTPNSANIRKVTKKYLGHDLTLTWHWENTSAKAASKRLDDLIHLRGTLVHRGRESFKAAAVRRMDVVRGIQLIEKLASLCESAKPAFGTLDMFPTDG